MQSCCQRLVVMEDISVKMSWQSFTANKTSCLLESVWRRTAESRRKFLSVLRAPGTLHSVLSCQFRNNGEKLQRDQERQLGWTKPGAHDLPGEVEGEAGLAERWRKASRLVLGERRLRMS